MMGNSSGGSGWTRGRAPSPGGTCSSGTGPQGGTAVLGGGSGLSSPSCSLVVGVVGPEMSKDHFHHHRWNCGVKVAPGPRWARGAS